MLPLALSGFTECGVVRNRDIQFKPTEPSISDVELNLIYQPPLWFDAVQISNVLLVYSIINSKGACPERIVKIERALNSVKRLKLEVGALQDTSISSNSPDQDSSKGNQAETYGKLEALKAEYDQLVSSTEIRDDLDFYWTICHLCEEHGLSPYSDKIVNKERYDKAEPIVIEEIRGYISENKPNIQLFHIILRGVLHLLLYSAFSFLRKLSYTTLTHRGTGLFIRR